MGALIRHAQVDRACVPVVTVRVREALHAHLIGFVAGLTRARDIPRRAIAHLAGFESGAIQTVTTMVIRKAIHARIGGFVAKLRSAWIGSRGAIVGHAGFHARAKQTIIALWVAGAFEDVDLRGVRNISQDI